MERNLDLIRALGLPDAPLPLGDLPLARTGRPTALEILSSCGIAPERLALINPGASTC